LGPQGDPKIHNAYISKTLKSKNLVPLESCHVIKRPTANYDILLRIIHIVLFFRI